MDLDYLLMTDTNSLFRMGTVLRMIVYTLSGGGGIVIGWMTNYLLGVLIRKLMKKYNNITCSCISRTGVGNCVCVPGHIIRYLQRVFSRHMTSSFESPKRGLVENINTKCFLIGLIGGLMTCRQRPMIGVIDTIKCGGAVGCCVGLIGRSFFPTENIDCMIGDMMGYGMNRIQK